MTSKPTSKTCPWHRYALRFKEKHSATKIESSSSHKKSQKNRGLDCNQENHIANQPPMSCTGAKKLAAVS